MKKTLLLLLLVASGFALQAQYGHRVYNADTLSNEQFNDGLITDIITSGGAPVYAAGGFTTTQTTAVPSFTRSRFNSINFSGVQLSGTRYFVFSGGPEVQNRVNGIAEVGAAGYVLSGAAYSSSTSGNAMILNVNPSGSPLSIRSVDMNAFDESFCTRKSRNNTTRYYTCGSSAPTALTSSQVFLMKHNAGGTAIDWLRRFNLPCGNVNALAEGVSVVDDSASGSVVVVGNLRFNSAAGAGCQQAFIAKFTSTGVLTWLRIISGTSLSSIELQSIRATNTPQDYILTGSAVTTALPGRKQILLMRVNTSGGGPLTQFVRLIRSNGPTPNFPVQNQTGFDVVTRQDSLNNISYYVSGVTQYTSTSTDGFLLRANSSGNPVFLREYFGQGNEGLLAIDMVDNSTSKGLTAFGTYDTRNTSVALRKKSWLAKTYFNLVSGCSELVDSAFFSVPTVLYTAYTPAIQTTFTNTALTVQTSTTQNQIICWNTVLVGGSNARMQLENEQAVSVQQGELQLLAYPNPVAGNELNIRLTTVSDGSASLVLMDVTGKRYMDEQIDFVEGENQFSLQLQDLPAGIYMINVMSDSGNSQSVRFIRK